MLVLFAFSVCLLWASGQELAFLSDSVFIILFLLHEYKWCVCVVGAEIGGCMAFLITLHRTH